MPKVKVQNKCKYWVRAAPTIIGPWGPWMSCSLDVYQRAGVDGGVGEGEKAFFQRFKSDCGEVPDGAVQR